MTDMKNEIEAARKTEAAAAAAKISVQKKRSLASHVLGGSRPPLSQSVGWEMDVCLTVHLSLFGCGAHVGGKMKLQLGRQQQAERREREGGFKLLLIMFCEDNSRSSNSCNLSHLFEIAAASTFLYPIVVSGIAPSLGSGRLACGIRRFEFSCGPPRRVFLPPKLQIRS